MRENDNKTGANVQVYTEKRHKERYVGVCQCDLRTGCVLRNQESFISLTTLVRNTSHKHTSDLTQPVTLNSEALQTKREEGGGGACECLG